MRYTDMIKNAEFAPFVYGINPYDKMTDAQVMDFKLTNARELTDEQRELLDERLTGVAPNHSRFNYDRVTEDFNKQYKGWDLPTLEKYFRDNSAHNMSEEQKDWFLKRMQGLKAQQAMLERHAKIRDPKFIARAGGYSPIEERKKLDAAKDEALQQAAETNPSWFDANKDWLTGAAVGSLAGATTYGLTELIPMLRRRRFIRALIGMGVGTAAGIGASKLV